MADNGRKAESDAEKKGPVVFDWGSAVVVPKEDSQNSVRSDHLHGPDCGHDHAHEDHCEHDHEHGHEHSHDHGPSCDHAHGAPRPQRPPGHRPAEDGGTALQLELATILPGESNEQGRFERFEELLRAHHAVRDAHIRNDLGHAELCIHYEADQLPAAQLLSLARATGVTTAERYRGKTWFIRGMDSAQCAQVIEYSLNRMVGILEATVAYAAERLVVEYDAETTSEKLIEARVEALGYTLETPQHGHVCSMHDHGSGLAPKLEVPLAVTGGVLTAAGFVVEHFTTLPSLVSVLCFAAAIASGGYFATRGALKSLRQFRVDIESLMVLAALGAAALGAWFEGAFLLFLFSVGHAIEHRAMDRARRAVEALSKNRPDTAQLITNEGLREVRATALQLGDRILVRPGDRLPVDGVIREGQSSLDQAALTGESVPVAKGPGDDVYGGSLNGDAALEIEVTHLAADSILSKMIDLVVEAEARQGPSQRLARKIEQRVVPWILGSALLLPVVLIAMGLSNKEALLRTVALLVAASPCALAISTPAAVLSAVARAARAGILVKGGAYLEALARIEAIAFDKTGTLTEGKPKLLSSVPFEGSTDSELLGIAAGLEAQSSHPLAKAVIEGAKARGVSAHIASDCKAIHGKGLTGQVANRHTKLGNLALFEDDAIPAGIQRTVETLEQQGQSTVVVQHGEKFLGVLGIADTARVASKTALIDLKRLGVLRTLILSGDSQAVAQSIAKQVGIDDVHAPLLPEGKVQVLRKLARTRRGVAMIGDGVNDAPALAAATVGVAMGGVGSDVALETADVVLMGDDLSKLPFAIALARQAAAVIQQNLVISLGVAGVLVVASVLGIARVSESVIFHEGSTLLVVANGLRLLRFRVTNDRRHGSDR